ncbi:MAG: HDOD domain-containing protein [Nocardioidaceae bacterium]
MQRTPWLRDAATLDPATPQEEKVVAPHVVARQPIIGLDDEIAGFRLLHRELDEGDPAEHAPDEGAELGVSLTDPAFDVEALVGSARAFCRPWAELLVDGAPCPPSVGGLVVEIAAGQCGEPGVIERCRLLRGAGSTVALELSTWGPGVDAVLDEADVVEIDVSRRGHDEILDLVAICAPRDVTLMATGCTSEADLKWAAAAGFELFQGPAVERPERIGAVLAPSVLAQVQLAAELLDERLDFRRVEQILENEPALIVQVLHEASLGAAGGMRRDVHSIREALVVLGTRRLRQWAALAVLGRNVGNTRSDALTVSLVRARMCAQLTRSRGIDRGYAFTAGMLSALDRMLGLPIGVVERRVDIDRELAASAFRRSGHVGELVTLVADYQLALESGSPIDAGTGEVDRVAASSFASAMSHIHAIERIMGFANNAPSHDHDKRFIIGLPG